MTVDNSLQEDTLLVTTDYPVSWDIQIVKGIPKRSDEGYTVMSVRWVLLHFGPMLHCAYLLWFLSREFSIKWPGSDFLVSIKDKTLGTKVSNSAF